MSLLQVTALSADRVMPKIVTFSSVFGMATASDRAITDLMNRVQTAFEQDGGVFDKHTRDAVAMSIENQVEGLSDQLGVSKATVWSSYAHAFDPTEIAKVAKKAAIHYDEQAMRYPEVTVSRPEAGRVIASMGQAARMVSFNYQALTKARTRPDALGILDAASDGVTAMGVALIENPDSADVTFDSRAVTLAHAALEGVISMLASGGWTTGTPRVDEKVRMAMAEDLALLSPHQED